MSTDSDLIASLQQRITDLEQAYQRSETERLALLQRFCSSWTDRASDPVKPVEAGVAQCALSSQKFYAKVTLQDLIEKSADAILIMDGEMILDCNSAAVRMMRCDHKEQLLALHHSQLSPEVQPDGMLSRDKAQALIPVVLEQQSHRFEWVHRRSDGEDFWVEVSITVVWIDESPMLYTVWREIGDRKQAEANLLASETRLRTIAATMPGAVFQFCSRQAEWVVDYMSEGVFDITGIPASEIMQDVGRFIACQHPDDVVDYYDSIVTAIETLTPWHYEGRLVKPDGDVRWWQGDSIPTRITNDEISFCGVMLDVTDRKQAEAALAASEAKFRSLVENANGVTFSITLNAEYTYLSPQFTKFFGYEVSEMLGQGIFTVVHPEDLSHCQQALTEVARTGERQAIEFRAIAQNGRMYWMVSNTSPILDADAQVIGFQGFVHDITDRKQSEAQMVLLQQAVDSSSDAISICTPDGVAIYQNPTFCKLYACPDREAFNQTGGIPASFTDVIVAQAAIEATVNQGSWVGEVEQQSRSGRCFPALIRTDAIRDEAGNLLALIGTITDISERIQAEAFLRQQAQRERLLNRLMQQIRNSLDFDAILTTIVQEIRDYLQIDRCNFSWYRPRAGQADWETTNESRHPDYEDPRGCYPAAAMGEFADRLLRQEVIHIDDVNQETDVVWQALVTSLGYQSLLMMPMQPYADLIGVFACGQHRAVRPWAEEDIELLQAVVEQLAIALNQANLYEQTCLKARELEETLSELRHTQSQLVQSEKMSSLGQLVAGVAHEINNPVNFIYGNLSYANDYTQDLLRLIELYQTHHPTPHPAVQTKAAAIDLNFLMDDLPKLLLSMKVGADRIQKIVASLRTFSRMDEAEFKSVEIHEGIESTLMILQNRLKVKPDRPAIELIREYGTLPQVECYAGQLNQVFMNILSNAIDALDERDANRTLEEIQQHPSQIWIQTQVLAADRVQICIRDNALGMPEAVRQRLFDPFFTTKPVGKGTGMGLSISYQIITDRHGGKLQCHSTPGTGSKFTIEIPLKQV